jgi:hypothetical protein
VSTAAANRLPALQQRRFCHGRTITAACCTPLERVLHTMP